MATNENEKKPVEAEEKLTPPADEEGVDTFLKAAKKLKEDSVSKEEFEKVKSENQKLLDFIMEGKELPQIDDKSNSIPSIAELQKIRHNPDATNLDYVKASLELREHFIKEKGLDPFASKDEEIESAKRTAEYLQKMVDEAAGDPKKFNFLLESKIAEDDPALAAALKKRRTK